MLTKGTISVGSACFDVLCTHTLPLLVLFCTLHSDRLHLPPARHEWRMVHQSRNTIYAWGCRCTLEMATSFGCDGSPIIRMDGLLCSHILLGRRDTSAYLQGGRRLSRLLGTNHKSMVSPYHCKNR